MPRKKIARYHMSFDASPALREAINDEIRASTGPLDTPPSYSSVIAALLGEALSARAKSRGRRA